MNPSVPVPAGLILDLIRVTETGRADASAYDVIFGHNEHKLTKPITSMSLAELQKNQPGFAANFGSSASGAYQFMEATLRDLIRQIGLTGKEIFISDLQDFLGFELLLRRGYQSWVEGKSTTDTFMIGLSKEWASFPVPKRMQGAHRVVERGQSYYAGDGVNKALIGPDVVWLKCEAARNATERDPVTPKPPKPEDPHPIIDEPTLTVEEWQYALATIGAFLSDPAKRQKLIEALHPGASS